MRHRFIALPLAALAIFAIASVAVAGGWAQVTAKSVPVDPPAGQETTIEISVLQHGVTPVSWPKLTVIATDAASGTVARAEATAVGPEGSYVAKLVFPSEGEWTLTFVSTDLEMAGSVPMHVAAPVAAGAAGAGATELAPLVLALLAVIAFLAIGGFVLRGRGASSESRLSVRT